MMEGPKYISVACSPLKELIKKPRWAGILDLCSFIPLVYNCNLGLLYQFVSKSRFCANYKDEHQTVPVFPGIYSLHGKNDVFLIGVEFILCPVYIEQIPFSCI